HRSAVDMRSRIPSSLENKSTTYNRPVHPNVRIRALSAGEILRQPGELVAGRQALLRFFYEAVEVGVLRREIPGRFSMLGGLLVSGGPGSRNAEVDVRPRIARIERDGRPQLRCALVCTAAGRQQPSERGVVARDVVE